MAKNARGLRLSSLLLILLMVTATLAGCSDTYRMKIKDNMYYIGATGTYYSPASLTYMPVGFVAEEAAYAQYKDADELYYRIPGADPEKYLSLVYDNYVSGLMVAEGVSLPTFRQFGATKIIIATNTDVWMGMAAVEDAAGIDLILSAFEGGEPVEYPASEAKVTYRLIFSSPEYPEFSMSLFFYHYGEGRTYLYDRGSRQCRAVHDHLLEPYLPMDD